MNGLLVVCRHSMDDIPLALFGETEREQAVAFINKINPDNPDETNPAYFDTDASTPIAAAIVTFVGSVPTSIDVIRSF